MQSTRRATTWLGLALAAFALAAAALLCMPAQAHAGTIETVHLKGTVHQTEARSMLAMVNEFRTNEITDHSPDQPWYWDLDDKSKVDKTGLKPFKWSPKLEKIAIQRAKEALVRYDHERPNGGFCFDLDFIADGNYSGENLARGYKTAESAYLAWREDSKNFDGQGHRRNLLSSYSSVGIACVEDENGVKSWALEIGNPSDTDILPSPDDSAFDFDCEVDTDLVGSLKAREESRLKVGDSVDVPGSPSFKVQMKDYWGNYEYSSPVSKAIDPSSWRVDPSDEKVVSVSNGRMKALAPGTATLKTTVLGHDLSYPVVVSRNGATLSLPAKSTVVMGSSCKLDVTTNTDGKLSYDSSDPYVAKVSADGLVTPVAPGKATITVKSAQTNEYEAASAKTDIIVKAAKTPLDFSVPDNLTKGDSGSFDYSCPSSGVVEWTSSDGSVLSVGNGYWQAKKAGTVNVTASVAANDYWPAATVTKQVKVVEGASAKKPCKISLLGPSDMTVGGSVLLFVHNDCGVAAYDWTTSDPKVAKVENGYLKALSPGKATITCRCQATDKYLAGETSFEVTVANGSAEKPAVTPTKPAAKPSTPKVSAPKGTSLTKVSKAKRAFTAKWRKASGVNGYQVRWATKSSMSGSKATTVRSSKATSKKVTKLKKRTKYYVQVRTYKVVKGKTYWSGWSKAKSVKTK